MRISVILLALFFSAVLSAQENKPTYEKSGEMVKATYYHDNGEVAQEGYYLDGKLHDQWTMFNTEGVKIAMGSYEMGQRSGKWYFWDEKEVKEVDYMENRIVNVIKHDNADALAVKR